MTSFSLIVSFLIVGHIFLLYNLHQRPDSIKAFDRFASFLIASVGIILFWPTALYFQCTYVKK